jgi:hypothetical protein
MRQTGQMPTSPGGAATQAPAGGAAVNTGVGTTPPTQVPGVNVQQVDTTRMDDAYGQQDATYDRMLAEQQKMWGDTQHMIQQNFSGQMRRNASNAARMGLSVGGASYLSGQRSAMNQAGNYARQANMDSMGQRIGIQGQQAGSYGQRAGAYGQVAGANAGAQNNANLAEYNRGNQLDDRAADAAAEQKKNANIQAADQIEADYGYLFHKGNQPGKGGQYSSLMTTYKGALNNGTDEEIAAAYNELMNFIVPIQQAREAWLQSPEKQAGKSFEDYMKGRA